MRRSAIALLAAILMTLPLATTASAQVGSDPTVEQQVLANDLITPTALAVAEDGRVIVTSREGQITVWEQDGTQTRAAFLEVDAYDKSGGQFDEQGRCDASPTPGECPAGYNLAEGGIHGILLAPDFMESGELYLYYTVLDSLGQDPLPAKMPGARKFCEGSGCAIYGTPAYAEQAAESNHDEGKFRLSRFTLDLDTNILDVSSEVPLFENPAEWFYCCHYGGDIEWKNDGTLLLSVGDDTVSNFSGGFSPHDQRPDWTFNNAVQTSQNLADRRGKMLRIDVAEIEAGHDAGLAWDEVFDDPAYDGVPSAAGLAPNPYSDEAGADPYVYSMGFRSNYRFAYNPETDHIYVGNVGPDGRNPDPTRGPAAHDEIEVVPPGGGSNHGWPYCIADNVPYNSYDFETGTAGEPFDCSEMTPAAVWYTYQFSDSSPFLQMGLGGNTAMGGVSYLRPDSGALRLPVTYDNTFIWMEYNRSQLWRMPITESGDLDNDPQSLQNMTGFVQFFGDHVSNPIDTQVGPDGALYVLEANGNWNSTAGTISRFACAGCTPDPADYGGVEVLAPAAPVSVASVEGGLVAMLPAGIITLLALGLLALVGVRRRGQTI